MYVVKDKKTKFILNPFSWSICNNFYALISECVTKRVFLFENVCSNWSELGMINCYNKSYVESIIYVLANVH